KKTVQPEMTEGCRPRKQETDLEIENDEQNRDQIKSHVKFHSRIVECVKAALIGGKFLRIGLLICHEEGDDEKRKADHRRNANEYNERQIGEQQLSQRLTHIEPFQRANKEHPPYRKGARRGAILRATDMRRFASKSSGFALQAECRDP